MKRMKEGLRKDEETGEGNIKKEAQRKEKDEGSVKMIEERYRKDEKGKNKIWEG